jgi:hypothetical protein
MSAPDARSAHVAFIRRRLASEWGRATLRTQMERGFRRLMKTEVGKLANVDALDRLVTAFSTDPFLSDATRPIVRTAVLLEMARLREDPEKLAEYVSPEAIELMNQLLAKPGLLPEKLVKRLLGHAAFEEIARDVLDQALKEFSEKVDPFRAEWGLPSLMKKGGAFSIGLSAFAKGIDTMRDELERRVEPERKRFLQAFARRALDTVAEAVVRKNDDAEFVALRREFFAWLLEQPVRELVANQTQPVTELVEKFGHAVAVHLARSEAGARRRRAHIELLLRAHERQPLEVALAVYGAKIEPDFDAIVAALWPLVENLLESPDVISFIDELVGGFYDEAGS